MVEFNYIELRSIWIEKLSNAGFDNAEYEANELLGYVLGVDSRNVAFREMLDVSAEYETRKRFEELVKRRLNGEPLQYIIGEWEFYGLPFKVGKGVLIPRQDTETLIDVAINKLGDKKELVVTDLCSGSGCIGIALEKHLNCNKVICVEKSDEALPYLKENLKLNGSDAEILHGDIFSKRIIDALPMSDLIISNPPYLTQADMQSLQREVTYEPDDALYGGEDGMDFYRSITRLYKDKINDGGMILFEIGINQEDEVMKILIQHGFTNVRTKKDLAGVFRCVYGYKIEKVKFCTDAMMI